MMLLVGLTCPKGQGQGSPPQPRVGVQAATLLFKSQEVSEAGHDPSAPACITCSCRIPSVLQVEEQGGPHFSLTAGGVLAAHENSRPPGEAPRITRGLGVEQHGDQ